jgi:hypothetical protein
VSTPFIVLAHEGPQARAYLSRLKRAGLSVNAIVLMIGEKDPTTGQRIGRLLPGALRRRYAEKRQEITENFWPRRIRAQHPWLVENMVGALEAVCPGAGATVDAVLGTFDYGAYAEQVVRVQSEGYSDPRLAEALRRMGGGVALFTGGGILRRALLDLPGWRFLHVHPGRLPQVRGADGLLWSMLLRERPGCSAFFMAPGIDEGEVIAADDLEPFRFVIGGRPRPDDATLYRALFSYCDPLLRAEFLVRRVLGGANDIGALPSVPQDLAVGRTYHFLHPQLRAKALERLFVS